MGQTFGAEIVERIGTAIDSGLETTRGGLSRQVCEWLDWRSVNGHLREIDARKALLMLEREGLIELPPAQCEPSQLRREPKASPPSLTVQVEGTLSDLGEVALVAVSSQTPDSSGV